MNVPMPDTIGCANGRCRWPAKLVLNKLTVQNTQGGDAVVVESDWACSRCGLIQSCSELQSQEAETT